MPNIKIKKASFIIFLFVSVFLLEFTSAIVVYSETYNTLNKILAQYNVLFEKGNSFLVKRNFRYPAKEKTFHTIIAQEKNTRMEIEIIKPLSQEEAADFSKSKYIIVRGLYEPQIIPYSGALTHTTDCPDNNKPIEIVSEVMGESVRVLLVNATERYVLGVWEDSLIKQKAAFAVLYDLKRGTLYQITIFQPFESFDQNEILNILKSLRPTQED